jgi:ankyrin repeat protein
VSRVAWLILVLSFASLLFGCGKPKEQATGELERLNLKVRPDDFVRSAGHGDIKALQLFFAAGIDPNVQNSDGYTALMAAAKEGQSEAVQKLLEQKAKVDVQGSNGLTALMLAAENNHLDIVKALLAKKADPNIQDNKGWTALMKAVYQGNTNCVVVLAQNSREEVNRGLLVAALMGHKETAQALLSHGAEIDSRADDGRTPLMLAASKGNADLVAFFLHKGADPSLTDKSGETAAALASASGRSEIVSLLQNAPSPSGAGKPENPGGTPGLSPGTINPVRPERPEIAEGKSGSSPVLHASHDSDQPAIAKNLKILSIEQEFLPVMLTNVAGKNAKLRSADGESYLVTIGDQLRGLDYKVTDIEARTTEDKDGNPVDDSIVKLRNTKTGQTLDLIKDVPAQEHPSYALLSVGNSGEPLRVEASRDFALPSDPDHTYRVLDIRPAQVVIKRIEDNRVFTLQRR